jgi:hypothetical protein
LVVCFCSFEIDVPPLDPKWNAFWRTSLTPVDPEPTPSSTNPSTKATARPT